MLRSVTRWYGAKLQVAKVRISFIGLVARRALQSETVVVEFAVKPPPVPRTVPRCI